MSKPAHLPLYLSIELDGPTTEDLQSKIKALVPGVDYSKYEVQRGVTDPAHLTLIFAKDLPLEDYKQYLDRYRPQVDHAFEIEVHGVSIDDHCVAVLAYPRNLDFHPPNRYPHLTMMLHAQQPVYSNSLMLTIFDHIANDGPFTVTETNGVRQLSLTPKLDQSQKSESKAETPFNPTKATFYAFPNHMTIKGHLKAMGFFHPKKPKPNTESKTGPKPNTESKNKA